MNQKLTFEVISRKDGLSLFCLPGFEKNKQYKLTMKMKDNY